MQVLVARFLVCRLRYPAHVFEERLLSITADWTAEQAKRFAKRIGMEPQYIVTIKDKRYA